MLICSVVVRRCCALLFACDVCCVLGWNWRIQIDHFWGLDGYECGCFNLWLLCLCPRCRATLAWMNLLYYSIGSLCASWEIILNCPKYLWLSGWRWWTFDCYGRAFWTCDNEICRVNAFVYHMLCFARLFGVNIMSLNAMLLGFGSSTLNIRKDLLKFPNRLVNGWSVGHVWVAKCLPTPIMLLVPLYSWSSTCVGFGSFSSLSYRFELLLDEI